MECVLIIFTHQTIPELLLPYNPFQCQLVLLEILQSIVVCCHRHPYDGRLCGKNKNVIPKIFI